MVAPAKAGGSWGVPLRLRIVRLLVALLAMLCAGTAAEAKRAAGRKPLPIAVGHGSVIVTPTFDFSRAVSATIGSAGGTLTTVTADGSAITLTLPRNALAGDEQVTMVPLLKLSGGGVRLLAGVQLGPDGLRLLQPGKLDIKPALSARRSQQVAFGYQGKGSQFGLVPLALGRGIEIPLVRLGGAGLAQANGGQLSGRESHPPSDIEGAFQSQLAAPLYKLRRHRASAADHQVVLGTLAGYFDTYVKPTLRAPGSSLRAWTRAATRSAGWLEEVQVLGFGRNFAKDKRLVRDKVFTKSLRKRWRTLTRACAGGATGVGNAQKALRLARVAQIRRTSSQLGGSAAITAGIVSCGQLAAQATLNQTGTNWQSGQAADFLSQVGAVVATGPSPLVLQGRSGTNAFTFASAHVPISERLTTWTLSPMFSQCAKPSFAGFTTDPNQLFAAFFATLRISADLFVGARPPDSRITVSAFGADMVNWSTTCPQPVAFSQAPGAMSTLGSVTGISPVQLSSSKTTVKFQGSANILSGPTVIGFGNTNGSVTVRFPR
jgi:hypothetical protein